MVKLTNSLLTCLLILVFPYFGLLQAQSEGKFKEKKSPAPILNILDVRIDGGSSPFFIEAGGMYKMSLLAEGEISVFYWAVYLDLNGDRKYDDRERLFHSEGMDRGGVETNIYIPKSWIGRNTSMKVIVADEPIMSSDRIGGVYEEVELPALIPFTSQIDTGLDEKHEGCISFDDLDGSLADVSLGIIIPVELIPSDYTHIDVYIYGYDPYNNPLVFGALGNATTNFTTNPTSIPGNPSANISLSIPLEVNIDYFIQGEQIGLNSCNMVFYMVVRGYRGLTSTPEIFYVELDGDVTMPSIEYVIAPICDCEISGSQMYRYSRDWEEEARVYPNPVRDHLNLDFSSESTTTAKIWGLNGNLIATYQLAPHVEKHRIELGQLSSGLYIIELKGAKSHQRFKLWKR